jgi:nucleoid-associated protein YgaU
MKHLFLVVIMLFLTSGCMVRTYEVRQQRPDQDLTVGNRGALEGQAPSIDPNRDTTRPVRVIEVVPLSKSVASTGSSGTADAVSATVPEKIKIPAQKYTVVANDTLQKISRKVYGTINLWMKIYNANRQTLKSPDSLKPGQVIDIPEHER